AVKRGWILQRRAERPDAGVVANLDDDALGRTIAADCLKNGPAGADGSEADNRLWTYGLNRQRAPRLLATQIETLPDGTRALIRFGGSTPGSGARAVPRSLSFPLRGR